MVCLECVQLVEEGFSRQKSASGGPCLPILQGEARIKDTWTGKASRFNNFSKCLIKFPFHQVNLDISNAKTQLCNQSQCKSKTTSQGFNDTEPAPSHRSEHLDMDHIYLPFWDFLWGYSFIVPCTTALAIRGVITLLIRSSAMKLGIYRDSLFSLGLI